MTQQTSETPNNNRDESAYPNTNSIGYKQPVDDFKTFLAQWKEYMAEMRWNDGPRFIIPTSNNTLLGPVVMLFGRGNLSKSMLLNRYRNIVLEANERGRGIKISSIIDSEIMINRPLYTYLNPTEGQILDPISYYDALANALAQALGKKFGSCKRFQNARKIVKNVQRRAEVVLREIKQQGNPFESFSNFTIESATELMRSYFPLSILILDHPLVKNATEETKKHLGKNLAQLREYLRARLDDTLCDYINPELRLGPALGEDLRDWARNWPLLILFDSYEEIEESDALLRIVMSTAGPRVGWILAGRNDLWNNPIHFDYNLKQKHSYKAIMPHGLGFAVDFNASKVGSFSPEDIIAYFTSVHEKFPEYTNFPPLSLQDAQHILDVTQGVPFVVKFAAEIFYETGNMNAITDRAEGEETILDQMVNGYLLHTHTNRSDCQKLYSLAMLRRVDQPHAITAALELTPVEAVTRYHFETSHFYQRYSFFFTEINNLSLHQDVRRSFRRWLLKHRTEPEIVACCKRLLIAQEGVIKVLEEQRSYTSLKARFLDDEWINAYLDLIEQQFWSDLVSGLKYLLSFMLAAAIYRNNQNSEAIEMGEFFSTRISEPYHSWWQWANQSLMYFTSLNLPSKELNELKQLEILIKQRSITFPPFIAACTDELRDVLLEHLDKTHTENESKQDTELLENASAGYFRRIRTPDDEKKYADAENLPVKALAIAHNDRGIEHANFERYIPAIHHYNKAIELDSNFAVTYYNRGLAYVALKEYDKAIADYTQAINLDPKYAIAYYNRGDVYALLKQIEQAAADYTQANDLDPSLAYNSRIFDYLKLYHITHATKHHSMMFQYNPNDIYSAWVWLWGNMGKHRINQDFAIQLKNIAQIDAECYVAHLCRAIALALDNKLDEGLKELYKAISIEPKQPDAYFWKGMLCAYYYRGRYEMAVESIRKAVELELVPMLLTPLYWLEKDRPDFFESYAKPLLKY